MAKGLITVMILSEIFVRGKMLKKGELVEVNEREAKELINRGVATDELKKEEDITVPIEDMKKDELIEYAESLGIEVPGNATKADIIEMIRELEEEN